MQMIKDILLQLLFIIVPILLYQSIWPEKSHPQLPKKQIYLITLLSSLSVILCMTFPIQTDGGLRYDLRSIPLIITILYAGYGPGLFSALIMIVYRLYLGGEGVFVTLLSSSLYLILPIFVAKRWCRFSMVKKMGLTLAIGTVKQVASAIGVLAVTLVQTYTLEEAVQRLELLAFIGVVHIVAMGMVIYLIEYVQETQYIRSQIQRSEKLKLISELAASVAHEVRNPLTVVRGFVQLLREQGNRKNEEYIRLVLAELERAEFIISDYLTLAKPHTEATVTLNIGDTASEVAAIMSSYALMNGVEIQTEMEERLFVRGDPIKLKQALMNLMKNSIEAMHNGGLLEISAKRTGRQVTVKIRDQGQGMSREQIQQLGLPYYSTKEKGTGLGLMVTFRIIESMGGTLVFDSEAGRGTLVTISLPVVLE